MPDKIEIKQPVNSTSHIFRGAAQILSVTEERKLRFILSLVIQQLPATEEAAKATCKNKISDLNRI